MHASLVLTDPDGNRAEVSSRDPAAKAEHRALEEERIIRQLQKTGDTPYTVERVQVETDGISTLPISSLNAMRREAIGAISEIRRRAKIREKVELKDLSPLSSPGEKRQVPDPALTAFFLTKPRLPAGYDRKVCRIYLPMMSKSELESIRETFRVRFSSGPQYNKEAELEDLLGALNDLKDHPWSCCCNPAPCRCCRNTAESSVFTRLFHEPVQFLVPCHGGGWGASSASISPELRLDEAVAIPGDDTGSSGLRKGSAETLEYCPSSVLGGCGLKCGDCDASMGFLQDRKKKLFPI